MKIGGIVYWYVERSVGYRVDIYVGDEVGNGAGGVGWYIVRVVGDQVGIDVGDGSGSGSGIDGDTGFGVGSVDGEEV